MGKKSESIPLIVFILSLLGLSCLYGIVAQRFQLFPAPLVASAYESLRSLKQSMAVYDSWAYIERDGRPLVPIYDRDKTQPGLTKITGYGRDGVLTAKVVDAQGQDVHRWNVDWFDVWPDANHLTEEEIPHTRPGTTIHGALVTADGGLVFNYEKLGLVRLDACSRVVWRLPRRTHHSVFEDEQGNFWVPDLVWYHDDADIPWPGHRAPFREYLILKISPQGEILEQYSIMDLLLENHLPGLLYMSATGNMGVDVTDDTLHMNDVEVFPSTLQPGVFEAGDVMVSLRNIHSIIVFNMASRKVRYLSVGKYIRQHDPDFIDGNHFSVFDNHNLQDLEPEPYSRLVIESALDGSQQEYYAGSPGQRFFTMVQGKHQWLENGNVLLTVAAEGRAIEVSPGREIVWEYYLGLSDDYIGAISEAERLPPEYDRAFFDNASAGCSETVSAE